LTFDPKPIGTASIAQVHRATLKDGSEVAVKVQHSHIRKNVRFDLITAEILYKIMSFIFPECKLQRVVDEAKRSLPIELDFQNEGRNAGKVS
jgi:aarF domain-containing kinase